MLRALSHVLDDHGTKCGSEFYHRDVLQTTGLLRSKTGMFLADSPDAGGGISSQYGNTLAVAVEVKTVVSPSTIAEAEKI